MFRSFPVSRQLFQKLFLSKKNYGWKRHYECRKPQPPPDIPKGPNFMPLAIGVGAAVTFSAGAALLFNYNADVRQFLHAHLGGISEPEIEVIPEPTVLDCTSVESDDDTESVENALNDAAPESSDAAPQPTVNLEQVKEAQASCEVLYMTALSACSLAAQAVGGLASDIARYAHELSGDGPHSAHSDKIVLQLLVRKREVRAMLQDAESAAAKARSQMNELRKSMSDLYCSEEAVAMETMEHIESSLSQEEKDLGAAELHLKQARESAAAHEQLLRNRVASITKNLKDDLGYDLYECNDMEQRELYLAAVALQLMQYRKQVELIKQAHEKKSSELLAMQGDEGNKQRLDAVLKAKEKELQQILQQENHHQLCELKRQLEISVHDQLEQEKSNLYSEHQEKLKLERAAFERELAEQIKVASDRIKENFDSIINMLNAVSPNLTDIELRLKQSENALKLSNLSHVLSEALQTNPFPQLNWQHQLQPVVHIVEAICSTPSHADDEFVHTVVSAIPSVALHRGVQTLPALKSRFVDTERAARRVSMLKETEGNSLFAFLLSYMGSKLLLHPVSQLSAAEQQNEVVDFKNLNNDEILDRAKFYVQQGDIRQAVSYMNMLQGVAQFVSSGWLQEAVTYLEVTQAASALTSYSTLLVHQFVE